MINLNCFIIFAAITMLPYATTPLQLNTIDKSHCSFLKLKITLKILLIIPVATASTEQNFFNLKELKTLFYT